MRNDKHYLPINLLYRLISSWAHGLFKSKFKRLPSMTLLSSLETRNPALCCANHDIGTLKTIILSKIIFASLKLSELNTQHIIIHTTYIFLTLGVFFNNSLYA